MLNYNYNQQKLQDKQNQSLAQNNDHDIQNKIDNIHRSSDIQLQQYQSKMNVQIPNKQKLIQSLKDNLIQFSQSINKKIMHKVLIKSNKQSCIFKVQVGTLTGNLSLLRVKKHSKYFVPKPKQKGSYGSVTFIKDKKKYYAIKRIQVDIKKSISAQLIEIFIAKIASVLGIGPYFSQIYGYDTLLFDDCIQFAMEKCETQFKAYQIQSQFLTNNLRKSLKIFHSLNICHNDIKYQNIGWSNESNKFVFLDFGFSSFNLESLGFKTLTNYKGTFRYVSPQMKKLIYLKSQSFIDLYYNDFYCLQMTFKQLKSKLQIFKTKLKFPINNDPQYSLSLSGSNYSYLQMGDDQNYHELFPFFRLKYHLFFQNLPKIQEIVNSEKKLINSFRSLICLSLEKDKFIKIYRQLKSIYKKFLENNFLQNQKQKKMCQKDEFLYNYIVKSQINFDQQRLDQNLTQFININVLTAFLKLQDKMQEIFYFINLEVTFDHIVQNSQQRNQFVRQLYNLIFQLRQQKGYKSKPHILQGNCITNFSDNQTLMYREIMIQMFQYFFQIKKVSILEQIHANLQILDEKNRQLAGIYILKLYQIQDLKAYIVKNFQYFIGKAIIYNQIDVLYKDENINNIKKIIEITELNQNQSKQICNFCNSLIYFMKTIRYYNKIKAPIPKKLKEDLLQSLQCYLSQQLINFVKFLNFCQPLTTQISENKINISSKYLKICRIRSLQKKIIDYSLYNTQQIVFQDIFSKIYFPISNIQQKDFNQKNYQLAFNLSNVLGNHVFGLNLLQVQILFQFSKNQKFVQDFMIQYFDGQKMDRVRNTKDLIGIYQCYERVLLVFSFKNEQILQSKKLCFRNVKRIIAQMALRFLQWTSYFTEYNQKENQQISKQQFKAAYYTTKGLAKLALGSLKEAVEIFLNKQCEKNEGFINLAIQIFVRSQILTSAQTKKLIQVLYNYYLNNIQQKLSNNSQDLEKTLFYIPNFSTTLIQVLVEMGQVDKAYQLLEFVLKNLSTCNCFFYFQNHPAIFIFLQSVQLQTSEKLFWRLLKKQTLQTINIYPGISLLLFYMFNVCVTALIDFQQKDLRRILIVCAYGFSLIYSYLVTQEKRYLNQKIFKQFKIGRTTPILKRFVFCDKQKFRSLRDNYMEKIKVKQIKLKVKNKIDMILKRR